MNDEYRLARAEAQISYLAARSAALEGLVRVLVLEVLGDDPARLERYKYAIRMGAKDARRLDEPDGELFDEIYRETFEQLLKPMMPIE